MASGRPVLAHPSAGNDHRVDRDPSLGPRYRDAKETARKWVNRGIAGIALPPGKGHTLDRYQQLIGYQVPEAYGVDRTGTNLGELIKALEKRGGWDDLTDRQQERALEVVGHNYFDLDSMREIVTRAADETAGWETGREPADP